MKGDFSRVSFKEGKHYTSVLLQQGRVQLDADWNEGAAIDSRRHQRALRDLVGASGSPGDGFRIAARAMLDAMESKSDWSGVPAAAELCVDYVDFLRGTASLRTTGATEIRKAYAAPLDLSGTATITFAVKSGTPPAPAPGTQKGDTGFSFFVSDGANGTGHRATWAAATMAHRTVGVWTIYTCPMSAPTTSDAGLDLRNVRTLGLTSLKTDWIYHFDSIQRDFDAPKVPLEDVLALDDVEGLSGWGASGTGTVALDQAAAFHGEATLKITGPTDAQKTYVKPRDLRIYSRVVVVTSRSSNPHAFLKPSSGARIDLIPAGAPTTASGWWTHVLDIPGGSDLSAIAGYGFGSVASGPPLNVAQVLGLVDLSGNFFVLGGGASGGLYVDGIRCEKESNETYYSQRDYPEPLAIAPADDRIDLVYADVWERHVTFLEDPDLREVALGGPDTCTRVQTIAQVKVLKGPVQPSTARLQCGTFPSPLDTTFASLVPGSGLLSTLVSAPTTPTNLCEIAPDADYLGLDNRLYRVEIHQPGNLNAATFKWSRTNGAIAVAVVEDVTPATGPTAQTIKVERLGRDRATALAVGDLIEILDDLVELSDSSYAAGIPVRRTGELRTIAGVDPDANSITLSTPLANGYLVSRHARVRKWDGSGTAKAFVDSLATSQLDFGDGVRISFDGSAMLTGDYWQFTARGITGRVERLDHAAPVGIVHHYCPLALIKWKNVGGRFEIVDLADCRAHLPALTSLAGTDVGYDDGCCGLSEDAKALAAWHGDVLEGDVSNVQQALDLLCARQEQYLALRYVSGDGQEGEPGSTLPTELVVAVENGLAEPVPNVDVDWAIIGSPQAPSVGTLSGPSPIKTDSRGESRVTWTLGSTPGLNLVRASLTTPQTATPEVIFNARAAAAEHCLCTITVGDGKISHGDLDGPQGLADAIDRLCSHGGGTLCLLRGTYLLEKTIIVEKCNNLVIEGNRFGTRIATNGIMALRFSECRNIELRDLEFLFNGSKSERPIDGIIAFADCTGVVMHKCGVRGGGEHPSQPGLRSACVLIESTIGHESAAGQIASIRECELEVRGTGAAGGVAVRASSRVQIARNIITIAADGGSYGVDLDDNSDLSVVDHNQILVPAGVPALGGIHVGSGCDGVTIRDNRIEGGASYGVTYGSVNNDGVSLGGLSRLTVEQNAFDSVAFGGIGPLPFQVAEGGAQPITDDAMVSGNRMDRCGFAPPPPINLMQGTVKIRFILSGGVVLWMGNGIRVLDNDIAMADAPTAFCGIILIMPGDGLAVLRNRIVSDSKGGSGSPLVRPAGGIFVFASVAVSRGQPAVTIGHNEITSTGGPALALAGNDTAVVVTGNAVRGLSADRNVNCGAMQIQFEHNSINTQVPGSSKVDAQVLLHGRHITFVGNHCICTEGQPQGHHVRLEGEPASITATGNHCLEPKTTDITIASLLLRGTKGALAAVGNITTNRVLLDPDDPAGQAANLTNVIA